MEIPSHTPVLPSFLQSLVSLHVLFLTYLWVEAHFIKSHLCPGGNPGAPGRGAGRRRGMAQGWAGRCTRLSADQVQRVSAMAGGWNQALWVQEEGFENAGCRTTMPTSRLSDESSGIQVKLSEE